MGRASRQKGSTYELKIAKILSERFPPLIFKRVPLSGGWDKRIAVGDIVPWEEDNLSYFAFGIECKNQKTLSLKAWFRQASEDTLGRVQKPAVVFHINRRRGFPRGEDFIVLHKNVLNFYLRSSFKKGIEKIHYKEYETSRWSLDKWLQEVFAYPSDSNVRAIFLPYEDGDLAILRFTQFLGIIEDGRVTNRPWGVVLKNSSHLY